MRVKLCPMASLTSSNPKSLSQQVQRTQKDTKRELFNSKSSTARGGGTMATLSEVYIKGVHVQ